MSGVIRNHSTVTFQGFSISQPFLGASLQFYPEMGTQELDDLINAYLPGSVSIQEKRATVSMDFFAFSQLTGETFKYYSVVSESCSSATSSAGSSPKQNSSSSSNFVSPVISDWAWSQSTPSSASVSTPSSATQEIISSKTSKRTTPSATKSQANDFSHLPGMKIMTKDGRDVTNSASRGCKTKEQRDHAHLMRIIKACDACKKKKVRCDPSHKKRTTTQAQGTTATPARLAKKAKTSNTNSRAAIERSPQPSSTSSPSPALFTEPSYTGLEILDMPASLSQSWESFFQFDDEPANVTPFEYDFFFDPAGHLTPESSQSPTTPSMVFSQPRDSCDGLQNTVASKPFPDELDARPPTLPYLDSSPRASNYVDFNLYSPEPSFLDDDVALLNDIGTTTTRDQNTLAQRRGSSQSGQSSIRQQVHLGRSPTASDDYLADDSIVASFWATLGGSSIVDRRHRRRPSSVTARSGVSQPGVSMSEPTSQSCLSDVISRTVSSQQLADALPTSSPQLLPQPHASSRSADGLSGLSATPLVGVGVLQVVGGQAQTSATSVSSRSQAMIEEAPYSMHTTRATNGPNYHGASDSRVYSNSSNAQLQVTRLNSSESRHITAQHVPQSSTGVFGLSGAHSLMAAVAGGSLTSKRRSLVDWLSISQCLTYIALLATVFSAIAEVLQAQAFVSRLTQLAVGLAIYKVYHSYSSLYDSRPEQSHLSTSTPKPQGLSDGARLLSCVSTRLRRSCRQNQNARSPIKRAGIAWVLGLAQEFS
ncbi:hypothetical protein CORC01_01419 [Colletotrichum orchidophilum]|uniref:Uncharacterized protein n=1 Tax=Colletotrichum orchidophilum TaxID=1209926 RepID=A0A1G4BQ10_9PEZI|nr:uncharacterized protein CORC01_01419 [Colletotrichum orchidophilum]OHF03366.1 hypothetical protein CORC01_01419 [Colletotrichum orchidophilum]